VNGEVRGCLMSTWLGGCVVSILIGFAIVIVPLWSFDQYLHWRAAQPSLASHPGPPAVAWHGPVVQLDLGHPLLALAAVTLLVAGLTALRRYAPGRVYRAVHRVIQVAGCIVAVLQPGLLVGAGLTALACRERPWPFRYLVRGCATVPASVLLAFGSWHWGWPLLLAGSHLPLGAAVVSALTEVLLGSAWLRLYVDMTSTAEAEVRMAKRGRRLQKRFERAAGPNPIHPPIRQRTRRHPAGYIDLGVDRVLGRALRLPIPALRRHATFVGTPGSGKTVAIARVIDGALSQAEQWSALILDCKGGDLRDQARELAEGHGVPFQEVNPGQAGSLRYDITQLGGPAELADKLTAAFPSTPDSAIYRDASYHALVHATAAHLYVNGRVDLDQIEAALDKTALGTLAGQVRELAPETYAALLGIAERMGNPRQTTSSAINGMASRLGALRAGRFATVLNGDGPALDLIQAATEPGITYISLPALASSADLRMMGRVLLSDLKLLAHHRLDPANRRRTFLVVLDEFSALDDPDNVRDLLRQAREAGMPCLTASQSLPEPGGCRNELLQAGVLLFLKCLPADADEFAMLAGTVIGRALVHEVEFFPVRSSKGATGEEEHFRCHPRWFRLFANPGLCGVRFDQPGELPTATIAQVYQNGPDTTLAGRAWSWLTERLGGSPRAGSAGQPRTEPAWQAGTEDEAEGTADETEWGETGRLLPLPPQTDR
jgi:hypothetical protein